MLRVLGTIVLSIGLTLGACSCAQFQKIKDANNAVYKPVEIGCVTATASLTGLTEYNNNHPFSAATQTQITKAANVLKKYCVRNQPITGVDLADGAFQDAAAYLVTTEAVAKKEGVH